MQKENNGRNHPQKTGDTHKKANGHESPKPADEKTPGGQTVQMSLEEHGRLVLKAKEHDEFEERFKRAQAEYENIRKRIEREKFEFMKFAKEEFIADIMPILDSLEMALKHSDGPVDLKAMQTGLTMIDLQVKKFLKDLGVERVKTVGEKFDPHVHEAVEVEEVDGVAEENMIRAELKPGYTFGGRLLRPAAVKIAKPRDTGASEAPAAEGGKEA